MNGIDENYSWIDESDEELALEWEQRDQEKLEEAEWRGESERLIEVERPKRFINEGV